MLMDCIRKQTIQCAQVKLKIIVYKTRQQKYSGKHLKNKNFRFPCCSNRENLSNHLPITTVGLMSTKLGEFFVGVRTDRQAETISDSPYGNMSTHKYFMSKLKIKS